MNVWLQLSLCGNIIPLPNDCYFCTLILVNNELCEQVLFCSVYVPGNVCSLLNYHLFGSNYNCTFPSAECCIFYNSFFTHKLKQLYLNYHFPSWQFLCVIIVVRRQSRLPGILTGILPGHIFLIFVASWFDNKAWDSFLLHEIYSCGMSLLRPLITLMTHNLRPAVTARHPGRSSLNPRVRLATPILCPALQRSTRALGQCLSLVYIIHIRSGVFSFSPGWWIWMFARMGEFFGLPEFSSFSWNFPSLLRSVWMTSLCFTFIFLPIDLLCM